MHGWNIKGATIWTFRIQGGHRKMLTKIIVRNFKQFEDITVDLDDVVVFVGPNDSGKTTALQALLLWDLGLRRWRERWGMVPTSDMQRPDLTTTSLLVLQRRFQGGGPSLPAWRAARRLWWERRARSLRSCVSSSHNSN